MKKQKHPPPQTALRSVHYSTSMMKSTVWSFTWNLSWASRVAGLLKRCGHTCLAADEEMAFLSSRSSSSARAEGVTGLAPPKERKKRVSICIQGYSRSRHVTLQVWNPHPGMTVTGQLGSMLFIILYFRLEHIFVTSVVFLYFTTPQ